MRSKVLYILSGIEKALAFEWIAQHIDKSQIELRFLILGRSDTPIVKFLQEKELLLSAIPFDGKKDLLIAWCKVFLRIRRYKPDVIHTHLYYGNLVGLSAAWLLRVSKRIHTRHHASIHHQYFPRTVYIDRLINWLSTDIIVLSTPLKEIVVKWEGTPESKVSLIPHGFDLSYFSHRDKASIEGLRSKYHIQENRLIVGVIARYTEWKGIQYIIEAFKMVLKKNSKAHLVLANAQGDYEDEIKIMLQDLPEHRYTEIVFEPDIASLYYLFDIYAHTPVDSYSEAFGQTYVEALAVGIPSVFTLSGIACDFVQHRRNALVVPYRNATAIAQAVEQLIQDKGLSTKLVEYGKISVQQRFALSEMIFKLQKLYLN